MRTRGFNDIIIFSLFFGHIHMCSDQLSVQHFVFYGTKTSFGEFAQLNIHSAWSSTKHDKMMSSPQRIEFTHTHIQTSAFVRPFMIVNTIL